MKQFLGYEGICVRCKQNHRAYYAFADHKNGGRMVDGTFLQYKSNCPGCVTSKVFQSANTVEWKRKLSMDEVKKDLEKHKGAIDIDFKVVDKQVSEDKASDKWWTEQEGRQMEYRKMQKRSPFIAF